MTSFCIPSSFSPVRCFAGLAAGVIGWSWPADVTAQIVEASFAAEVIEHPRFEVVGRAERLPVIGGSADVIGEEALTRSHVFTANEALRRVPGLQVRDEEGFGLRPNIGLRGLNPTRTTKITLLEDGLPLAYSPYGDNASYYHPPIDRFAALEVLKGAHSLFFGPQTIGGVINYLTPGAPTTPGGFVQLSAGSRSYFNAHLRAGGHGVLVDYTRKQGDGARDNLEHVADDWNAKYTVRFGGRHTLTLRGNLYTEDSTVTYSGLTQAEFDRLGARYNPFKNDAFDIRRTGLSITHRARLVADAEVTTSLYHADFERDWWRQSSNSQDGQHGAGAVVSVIDGVSATFLQHRLAGRRVDPDTQFASTQGRLRAYETTGIDSRLTLPTAAGELQAGVKLHHEEQDRQQINGSAPTARSGARVEDNSRETVAWSAFAAHRFTLGNFTLTPVTRYEAMEFERLNRLNGLGGRATLDRVLPGLGATWQSGSIPRSLPACIAVSRRRASRISSGATAPRPMWGPRRRSTLNLAYASTPPRGSGSRPPSSVMISTISSRWVRSPAAVRLFRRARPSSKDSNSAARRPCPAASACASRTRICSPRARRRPLSTSPRVCRSPAARPAFASPMPRATRSPRL